MDALQAAIVGLVQGLTEFLPISSSAHVRLVSALLGIDDPGALFTAVIQIGTELAVLVYFWRDIVTIVGAWARSLTGRVARSDPHARMGWFIILGSLPIVVLGLLFQDAIETTLRSLWVVAVMLIVFGALLGVADAIGRRSKGLGELTTRDAVIFGFAQALALIPGVSRSGGTITAGRLLGYERPAAARYSFLLALPAVFGSGLYGVYKGVAHHDIAVGWAPTLIATAVAFVVGLLTIRALMAWIGKHSFAPFVWYRVLLGGVLLALLGTGTIAA